METKKGITSLLTPYRGLIFGLLLFTLLGNAINLWLPRIISRTIDAYGHGGFRTASVLVEFMSAVVAIFFFSYLQSIIQTYASEKVGRDLRSRLSDRISSQPYDYIERVSPAKLLTNLTADVDSIKLFVSQAIVSIVSSAFIIVGASILMLTINWRLALIVIAIIPTVGVTFFFVLKKVRKLFFAAREVMDWLNKVITESILGAAIIRVVNAQQMEYVKFLEANTRAKAFGMSILRLFATLIPVISFAANMASLGILLLGGKYAIEGKMTLGNFAAFTTYLTMIIFPILVIGFMSNVVAQANASFDRIRAVLETEAPAITGILTKALTGSIHVRELYLLYGQKPVLKNISFAIRPGSRTAVVGPTAGGKTQLLYVLIGLVRPTSGAVLFDGKPADEFDRETFYKQVGFVFQDSIVFALSIRENIAFSDTVTDESLEKAIATAELGDFIASLPEGLNTVISERGSNLSGGQKQRMMLARALAGNPVILFLDDFTARVDNKTETKILQNIRANYPGLTLVSVTQKIGAVTGYDQIIVLTQGEIAGSGLHGELLQKSTEYAQLFHSQQSTSNYELQS